MLLSQKHCLLIGLLFTCIFNVHAQTKINRQALVQRHNITIRTIDTLGSLSIGNGAFAFTLDITGLQTFPSYYKKGVPLGTQSEWGWHSFPNIQNYNEQEALKTYHLEGKDISYAVQSKDPLRAKEAADYFRINQHRLQLGNIGLEIKKKNGELINVSDVEKVEQHLDMWTGKISSHFLIEGIPVDVITYANQSNDAIASKITSPLIQLGRLAVRVRLPYPTGAFADEGVNYGDNALHQSYIIHSNSNEATIQHVLDTTVYYIQSKWKGAAMILEKQAHYFLIVPAKTTNSLEIGFCFTPQKNKASADYVSTMQSSIFGWKKFWLSGAAIDFSGSTDKRAFELERRVVLSQYLTKIQCAGSNPPQETGLTYNSWFGKPHMEMYWWHAAHFALWNRTDLLEKSMKWYFRSASKAKEIATRQGFDGLRWQKMTDNDGREVASSVGAFLVWQQPHLIYLAELIYRNHPTRENLEKYKQLVFGTANFMASFPTYDAEKKQYNLGKGLIPAQECFNATTTFNPTYELAYWSWGLQTAQAWNLRLGLPRNKDWDKVLKRLAPLPQKNGVYLATESTPDCYDADSKYLIDHPAVLAALASIPPSNHLDTTVMHRTFLLVDKIWNWEHTWGWDFPLVAMTAARLQLPSLAVDALFKDIVTNTYLVNGHNYQSDRLTIYLPGNGGLLSAVAMMAAGWDGAPHIPNPGFPQDGSWKLKWEGLKKMP
jgi:hypothetical protein